MADAAIVVLDGDSDIELTRFEGPFPLPGQHLLPELRQELGAGVLKAETGATITGFSQVEPGRYRFRRTQGAAADPAGCTVHQALNSSLPAAPHCGDLSMVKVSCKPGHSHTPDEVRSWQHADPDIGAETLDEAILTFQQASHHPHLRLHPRPASLTTPINSEAAVASCVQPWVAEPLANLARQVPGGERAVWFQVPPKVLLHTAVIRQATHPAEVQAPAPLVVTQSGRVSRPPSAGSSEPSSATISSNSSNLKMDFVLAIQDEEQQQQQQEPSADENLLAKHRCICVGEVKKPSALLCNADDLPDLVAQYQAGEQQAVAVINQICTYMQLWHMCYGYITCWLSTWLVYCPPKQRRTLYVSRAYSSHSAGPSVTVLGALAWMQDRALRVDQSTVDDYPTPGQAGASEDGPGGGPDDFLDDGAKPGSQDWDPKQDSSRPRQRSNKGSRGGSGGSSMPQQQGRTRTLQLHHQLQEGSAGAVVVGAYGGVPAIVKLLGPDSEGLEAYEAEVAAYSLLSPVQGVLVPRLLGAGSLPGGVAFIATSKEHSPPLCALDTVPPAVAGAAVKALAALHSQFPGFLHNDIRLANILLSAAGNDVNPQCMFLDFGRSRLDATKDEQRRELGWLKKKLGM